jgi:PKD repeat protein
MKRINIVIFLIFNFVSIKLIAQNYNQPCVFDQIANNEKIVNIEKKIQEGILNLERAHDIKTIPVVVHIFHEGGSENISEAQVQSAIQVLNEDFGKLPGTNGDGNGVDTEVRFKLAKIDPNGNCTNGIVRINSSLTNHQTYERPLLKEISFWDNTKYLNIYIVKSIPGGVLGYSSFPGAPADEDGLVVRHNRFGTIGTAINSLGRTTTHEVGHWLGLYHTFNNGCGTDICNDGDYVCDTPPVSSPNYTCATNNSCSNDSPDVNDQITNYMDYTPESCSNMFTQGQADRILSTLTTIRTNIWTQANLIATGTDDAYVAPATCSVVANFTSLNPEICVNNAVNFIDISLNNATSWTWYFTGGTPATSTAQNPSVTYSSLGMFDVKLVVSDGTESDSITLTNFVNVTSPGIGDPLPYQENFDSGTYPPNGITINNPDGGITWVLDSNAYVSPNYSIRIDNLNNTNYGTIDEIILPYLDLTTSQITPYMYFKWAYAKSDVTYSDELIVQISTDCGATWNQLYYLTGSVLSTGPVQTTPFIPNSDQWKSGSINLSNYETEQYVSIKFINVTDGGNYLYIDDINIGDQGLNLIENNKKGIKVYPNPNNGNFIVDLSKLPNQINKFYIYSIEGKLINSINLTNNTINFIDVDLPSGVYILNFIEDNQVENIKFIVE